MHMHSERLIDVLEDKQRLASSINFNKLSKLTSSENGSDFSGQITLSSTPKGLGVTVIRDEKQLHKKENFETFPIQKISLSSYDGVVTPEVTMNLQTQHPNFNLHIGLGTNIKIKGSKSSLLTLPFSFLQKNANCVHNGIMLAVFDGNNIGNVLFQISSETCAYYKFDYIALYQANLNLNQADFTPKARLGTVAMPVSIDSLYQTYNIPGKVFADSKNFIQSNVTLYGLIDGDTHYASNCQTREGLYPLCEQMLLPSYSLAKSLAGTLGISLIENEYKSISNIPVKELVEECRGKKWNNITIENLSDMAAGNFISTIHDIDEAGLKQIEFIFDKLTDSEKIKTACSAYPRKSKPGSRFVYHTSDTYILGKALNQFLIKNTDLKDYYSDLLAPLFANLDMSYATNHSLRTVGESAQPYTGWGMYFLPGDLVKLSNFVHKTKKDRSEKFSFLKDVFKKPEEALIAIPGTNLFYNNGFWLRKYNKGTFGCKEETWVPFMSGFGGITMAFLPNNMTYYYFSDGYTYSWDSAVFTANEIKPFCKIN